MMRGWPILLLLLVVACDAPVTPRVVAVHRDSAGLEISENPVPDDATPVVRLSTEPLLTLGRLEGPAVEQFGRIVDVRLLSGAVAVLDPENHRIVLFGLDGRVRRTIGHEGEGPGDMRRAGRLLSATGDALTLWDYQLRRVTRYDTTGAVLDTRTLPTGALREEQGMRYIISIDPQAQLGHGRIVGTMGLRMRLNPPTGVYHDSMTYWLVDSVGGADSLAARPAAVTWNYVASDRTVWFDSLAYAPRAADAFTDLAWYRIEGDRFEITRRNWAGVPQQLMRSSRTRRPVTAVERARARERGLVAEGPQYADRRVPVFDWMPDPDSMPAYDQLVVGDLGLLWARVFPDTASVATWDLFRPDGTLMGTVRAPSALNVRDITADYLLAQRVGDLGEPLVELYSLTRPQ
jgi:hypothetical protein